MSEPKENVSFSSVLKKCYKDVYEYHQVLIQDTEEKVENLKEENEGLIRQRERLKNEVDMLKDRMSNLQVDNQRLKDDLVNTSTRLSARCENCTSMLGQITEQNKLLCSLMEKKDYSLAHILEKYLKTNEPRLSGNSSVNKNTGTAKGSSILETLSQALLMSQKQAQYKDFASSEEEEEEEGRGDSLPATRKSVEKKQQSQQEIPSQKATTAVKNPGKRAVRCAANTGEEEQYMLPDIDLDNVQNCVIDKVDGNSSTEVQKKSPKISPNNTKLKLNRAGKRSRCKYIEEGLSESNKKKKLSPKATSLYNENLLLQYPEKTNKSKSNSRAPVILAPDTCVDVTIRQSPVKSNAKSSSCKNKPKNQVNFDDAKNDTSNSEDNKCDKKRLTRSQRERLKNRPNLIIPETVPMDMPSSSEEEDINSNEIIGDDDIIDDDNVINDNQGTMNDNGDNSQGSEGRNVTHKISDESSSGSSKHRYNRTRYNTSNDDILKENRKSDQYGINRGSKRTNVKLATTRSSGYHEYDDSINTEAMHNNKDSDINRKPGVSKINKKKVERTSTISSQQSQVHDNTVNDAHSAANKIYSAANNTHSAANNTHTAAKNTHTAANNTHTAANNTYTAANNTQSAANNTYTAANNTHSAANNPQSMASESFFASVMISPPSHASTPFPVSPGHRSKGEGQMEDEEMSASYIDEDSHDGSARDKQNRSIIVQQQNKGKSITNKLEDNFFKHKNKQITKDTAKKKTVLAGERSIDDEESLSDGEKSPVFGDGKHRLLANVVVVVDSPSLFDDEDEADLGKGGRNSTHRTSKETSINKSYNQSRNDASSQNESSLLLSKPLNYNDSVFPNNNTNAFSTVLSTNNHTKGSDLNRSKIMSPLKFSNERPGEAKVSSRNRNNSQVKGSPSFLSGKIKTVCDSGSSKTISSSPSSRSKRKSNQSNIQDARLAKLMFGASGSGKVERSSAKLFQTKLTADAFQTRPRQTRIREFNGQQQALNTSLTQHEELLIEQAKQASLQQSQHSHHSQLTAGRKEDMVTSTPAVKSRTSGTSAASIHPETSPIPIDTQADSRHVHTMKSTQADLHHHEDTESSPSLFKKPEIPQILATTPKRRKNQHHDESIRRSPRLKNKYSSTDEDSNDENHSEKQQLQRTRPKKLDLLDSVQSNTEEVTSDRKALVARDLNGTVDPNLNLAEFESLSSPEMLLDAQGIESVDSVSTMDIDRVQSALDSQTIKRMNDSRNKRSSSKRSTTRSQKLGTRSSEVNAAEDEDYSEKSAVFGPMSGKTVATVDRRQREDSPQPNSVQDVFNTQAYTDAEIARKDHPDDNQIETSFDRLPEQQKQCDYKYVNVVRKRDERAKLDAFVCRECEEWYNGMGIPEEEKKKRMKATCKHKATFAPPPTPEHYWSVGFPDTQECKERNYYRDETQVKPSKHRRQRPLKQLFKNKDKNRGQSSDDDIASDFSD